MKDEILLSVKDLYAGYGERPTVAALDLTLRRGEILCVVGESGCGKSTLLKALLGAAAEPRVLSGEISLEGESLTDMPPQQRRKLCCERMGMVFQSPGAAFNPIRSYKKQFVETLKSHGLYRKESFLREAEDALGRLGLAEAGRVLAACPYEMSGGMNQRVALALLLLLGQDVLLADEPTSALDATIQLQVAEELKKLREAGGVTEIVVTHNLALAQYLADTIGVMYAGRLVEYGSAQTVLSAPAHPYTRSLIAAVPKLHGDMPTGLAGQPPAGGPQETGCEFCARCPCADAACGTKSYRMEDLGGGHFASCTRKGGGET